ncbi:MAG: hypothetical protein ACREOB_10225, partial [Thermodesulfobacteriota bacterium]
DRTRPLISNIKVEVGDFTPVQQPKHVGYRRQDGEEDKNKCPRPSWARRNAPGTQKDPCNRHKRRATQNRYILG